MRTTGNSRDDDVKPVFRVYEHGSDSVFVDVPTQIDGVTVRFGSKKCSGSGLGSPDWGVD